VPEDQGKKETTAGRAPRTPVLEEQIARLKAEIANLTVAIAAGGGGTVGALVQAIRDREQTVAMLDSRLRGLKAAPDIIGLETRRMEKEARDRLASFQRLAAGKPAEARRVFEALLDKPLVFTPTPEKDYVIEGPVYLGALLPKSCDPSGLVDLGNRDGDGGLMAGDCLASWLEVVAG
jgi:hypothetical protein